MVWTVQRVDILRREAKKNKTNSEIGVILGCSSDAIQKKRQRMNVSFAKPETPEDVIEGYNIRDSANRKRFAEKQLVLRIKKMEAERDAWFKISGPCEAHKIKTVKSNKISATAFICMGDWHCEEEVRPSGVSYLNEYNLDVADRRMANFWNNAIRLLEISDKDTKLDGVVLVILGDMITGAIHEENADVALLKPVPAILWMQVRLVAGIKMLLAKCAELNLKLRIVGKVGNHSRITDKIHIGSEEGYSLEWMMYKNLEMLLPEAEWILDPAYHTYLDLYGKKIRIHHGSAIKNGGGVGGVMIAIAKANDGWNRGIKAHLNIMGHLHQQLTAFDTILVGSGIGYNRFAVFIKAKFEEAQQKYFLWTSKGIVTSECPIFLEA